MNICLTAWELSFTLINGAVIGVGIYGLLEKQKIYLIATFFAVASEVFILLGIMGRS